MSADVLEIYTRQFIGAQHLPETTFAWQGGEPTLMGLEFFKKAVAFQQQYTPDGMIVNNALQTNGTTLNDDWCRFLKENNFLVGISIDGPRQLHDIYRIDKGGAPTFERVMSGLELLQKHAVDFNILCAVHAANQNHPLEVYRFFRDTVQAQFIQFIPIVERINSAGFQKGDTVTERSVSSNGYGQFLTAIFDEWVRHDVGQIFVQIFDVALGQWFERRSSLCVFAPTCGNALALEHNGNLYACDHYVEPGYFLGNIMQNDLIPLVTSDKQAQFGQDKKSTLPRYCQTCNVRFACNGGCPKNRFIETADGEVGLNYLCTGYKHFFQHIDQAMRFMANELTNQHSPANIMKLMNEQDTRMEAKLHTTGRNMSCPCGSGRKYKYCHGRISIGS